LKDSHYIQLKTFASLQQRVKLLFQMLNSHVLHCKVTFSVILMSLSATYAA
jgi:hypothetical protein